MVNKTLNSECESFILLVFKVCLQGLILSYILLKFFKRSRFYDNIELFKFGRKFCIKLLSLFWLVLVFESVDTVRYYTSSTTKWRIFFVVKNKDTL
jgi:hypothetical protein